MRISLSYTKPNTLSEKSTEFFYLTNMDEVRTWYVWLLYLSMFKAKLKIILLNVLATAPGLEK